MERYLSLKDHVYQYISERISNGTLSAGDKINEVQISEELNVSRTPVREALVQLAADGYLQNLPRKGFRVQTLNTQRVRQLYEVIGTLDGRAASMCVDLLSETDIKKMQILAESMDAAIEAQLSNTYYEMQIEFHDVYLNLCPNTILTETLQKLKNNFIRKYYLFENPENEFSVLHETNQQHYEIIRLFREKKADELERFIRDCHWNGQKAEFESLSSE